MSKKYEEMEKPELIKRIDEVELILDEMLDTSNNESERKFLALVWKVATDSIKNCKNGNQNIGALNDCFIETRKRLYTLGITADEIKTYE